MQKMTTHIMMLLAGIALGAFLAGNIAAAKMESNLQMEQATIANYKIALSQANANAR